MTGTEVAEHDAPAGIAAGYQRIRDLLDSTFVPTIYRRLAMHPEAFSLAVDHLPQVVALGVRSDFVSAAQSAARTPLTDAAGHVIDVHQEVADVVERYRRANPLNLLFSMSIAGVDARPEQPVMEPPLPPRPGVIWEDILESHGGVITPGLWRDLAPWPDDLEVLWRSTRAVAADGWLAEARQAVRLLAVGVLAGSGLQHLPAEVSALLPAPAVADFAWFPTGVATMVAEGEWLNHVIAHPNGRNSHEQA
ncbi:MAG: hypothetical protein ACYC2Z_00065 [Candidatus Nanopelagicales bacterium]